MPVITELEPVALSADCPESRGLYPIREVARLTGINPVTLRAWERRYGLIQPIRTISGHRLYSVTDIETVRRVMGWLERGVAVSKVAQLLANDSAHNRPQPAATEYSEWQSRVGAALSTFNEPELDRLYGQIYSGYPAETVFHDIFLPLYQQLFRSRDEFGRTSEWLLLDGFLRTRVQHRLQMQAAQASQCVLMVAVPELCHELELLVAGLLLSRHDRVVRVLPTAQPLDELALICEKVRPTAVVLFAQRTLAAAHHRRLVRLVPTLNCPTFLAGQTQSMAHEALKGTSIVCLGREALEVSQRLDAELLGHRDS